MKGMPKADSLMVARLDLETEIEARGGPKVREHTLRLAENFTLHLHFL